MNSNSNSNSNSNFHSNSNINSNANSNSYNVEQKELKSEDSEKYTSVNTNKIANKIDFCDHNSIDKNHNNISKDNEILSSVKALSTSSLYLKNNTSISDIILDSITNNNHSESLILNSDTFFQPTISSSTVTFPVPIANIIKTDTE